MLTASGSPTEHLLLQHVDFTALSKKGLPQVELDNRLSKYGKTVALVVLPAKEAAAVSYASDTEASQVREGISAIATTTYSSKI